MNAFWRNWMWGWCAAVGLFGAVLALGGLPATGEPARLLLDVLNGPAPVALDGALRFSVAVLGAVTIGWSLTLAAAIRAALELGEGAGPVWRLTLAGVVGWFVIDSILSVATGFALNVVPNLILLATFLWPLQRSGALRSA
ncbi:MAG: hypothetical protein ACK4YQ_02660 [Phenylobacterium sp.]|uniref:hypothetical protein n=1 Tax=Phenylobacterium sp. TaxID=1871053 RepID=UPI00391BA534